MFNKTCDLLMCILLYNEFFTCKKKTELCTEVLEPLKTKLTIVLIETVSDHIMLCSYLQR